MSHDLARHWSLEPGLDFLNHGSFGACPLPVLERQQELRCLLESQPVTFFVRQYNDRIDEARAALAEFVGVAPAGLVPVPNATTGVNAVLRSLRFDSGDELLTTDHAYNACRNALEFVAQRWGARLVVAELPFPLSAAEEIEQAIVGHATDRTRLAMIDHVTSPTGMILPIASIARRLEGRGIEVLVDGAHAPGMLELQIEQIGCSYYTGNCHKWICAPKGAAFLWVRADRREGIHPLTISHGANISRPGRTRFQDEFDWTGTHDPTAFLSVPAALQFTRELLDGGWDEARRRNRELALHGRASLTAALRIDAPCPEEMIGSLVSFPLPDGDAAPLLQLDPLQDALMEHHRIEVPVMPWPGPPRRVLRISAQLYNRPEQYDRLGEALRQELR